LTVLTRRINLHIDPMGRSFLLSTLVVLGLLAACSDGTTTTAPPQPGASSGDPGASSGGDPGPAPTSTTTPTTTTPPEPEWVPPVVATSSPACGTPRADAVHADFTTPSGRTFHVWGPSGYDPKKTYPVVLVFHGIYASGAAHQSWFKMEDYTNNEAFVVYPDALGATAFWDTSGNTDLAFFDEMMKQLGNTYCINPSRVLGFGFSYGGHFADHLGCKRAGHVKAIVIGDGGPSGDDRKCGRLPVLVTTRTADTDETVAYGRNAEASWSNVMKCGALGDKVPQSNKGENMGYCVTHAGCKAPGGLTYCEDPTTFSPEHPEWNHTVREYYRSFAFQWFKALP
jgi:polyhydroxybutyrate depolymerase